MDRVNIKNVLTQEKSSNRGSSYYDLQIEFQLLIVENKITFTFGNGNIRASFQYDSNNYCIENGAYFEISNCIFKDNVEVTIDNPTNNIKWINCIFEKDLIIKSSQSVEKMHKISNFILESGKVNNLVIDNTTANFKFYINPQEKKYKSSIEITNLKINDSKFIENFKLHHAIVNKLEIENVDFEQNADFFKSVFNEGVVEEDIKEKTKQNDIGFKAINFKKLALFGDTEFNRKLIFKYVTFEGHNHFKSAKLHKGLDLEYTNVQKEINFYGIEILDKTTTSQETYRIIKNQFEKLNNKIEANKYHALELEQRKKELEKNKWQNFSEYSVFKIHDISSKHSTSWFRALLWIIFIGFVTIFLVHFEIVKDLFFHPNHFKIEYISKIWNEFWQYINITNLEKLKDKPFIFFLNKVSLGYLYYQFLTAVRKDTRK